MEELITRGENFEFNQEIFREGGLIRAKHYSWREPRNGIIIFAGKKTSAPDPIEALNHWAENFSVMIIGKTDFEECFEPTHETPAIYFDVERIRLAEQKNTLATFDATINLHVFAPNVRSRRAWLAELNQELCTTPRFFLSDGSVMTLEDSEYLWSASEVQGQIQFKFRYGVPRKFPYAHPLNHINFATGGLKKCTRLKS